MDVHRKATERRAGRAFRPNVDGALESRFLLSAAHVSARAASSAVPPIQSFTFDGGHGVRVETSSGQFFDVHLTGPGVVRAFPLSSGRVFLRVDGSAPNTVLSIDPVEKAGRHRKESAHRFSFPQTVQNSVLNVGGIAITSGTIFQILAYRTADLSGPISIGGTNPVDRIAFLDLLPGASIGTGGDLNTLDVYNNVNLTSGPGIYAGRDLNWFNIGGNVSLTGGASLFAVRDIGLVAQPSKGTGPGGQGGVIGGNLLVAPPGVFGAGRFVDAPILVRGSFLGTLSQIVPPGAPVIVFA
jgi:hypothetical protein